ncbi:MAG: glycosyltransferase family 2 protein, partial [Pyramidobacter sp.]|nr:glycosyltransferase family 2 protein [Pyramidobacter sp.]
FTVLMDHDDTISPAALYEVARTLRAHPDANVIYSDEDKIDERDKRNDPFFKCNWDPYRILCQNYVSHLGAYRTSLLKEIGGFRKGYEGSQDHDLLLRATLRSRDDQIVHVPKVLYHWRHYTGTGSFSDAFLKKCEQVRRQCVRDYLAARGFKATVAEGYNGYNKVVFALPAPLPRVTCIVPAKDHADLTERCIDGVLQTNYQNLEVILVDNGSTEPDALELCRRYEREGKVRVIRWNKPFNYSEINNMAAREATGEYLLLLNNDVKPIATDWLTLMLGYASQSDVGCVGARLLFPNDTIQHAGVVLGIGTASHLHLYEPATTMGYVSDVHIPRVYSAVTAACLMIKKERFFAAGGLDEEHLKIGYNDVDLCLKVMALGYRNVYVPYATLYHYESASRGSDDVDSAKRKRFEAENAYMRKRWPKQIENDPYYNPNLTRRALGCEIVDLDEKVLTDDMSAENDDEEAR